MAWRSSGATNDELIDNLFANEIASDAVQSAMRSCDRKNYVVVGDAYQDSPQTIGYGATISAPHMHAHCLSMLEDQLVPGAQGPGRRQRHRIPHRALRLVRHSRRK